MIIPPCAQTIQVRRVAEYNEMMARAAQAMTVRETVTRREPFNGFAGVRDERASGVGHIEHRASARLHPVIRWIRWRQRRHAVAVTHLNQFHHKAMNVIRHFKDVVIGNPAFGGVTLKQRRFRSAAHDKGKLPGDVGGVHQRRIDALPAKRTGQVRRIPQQESPPVADTLSGTLVHFEVRNPAHIVHADVGAGAGIEQRGQLVLRRKLGSRVGLVTIDKNKEAIVR